MGVTMGVTMRFEKGHRHPREAKQHVRRVEMNDLSEFQAAVVRAIRQEWSRRDVRSVAAVAALARAYHDGKLGAVRMALDSVRAEMTAEQVAAFSAALAEFRDDATAMVADRTVSEFMADYRTAGAR